MHVISFVKFERWWVLKSKIFGQNQQDSLYFVNTMNVTMSKIGHDFRKKVCQKLKLSQNIFFSKPIFFIEKKSENLG